MFLVVNENLEYLKTLKSMPLVSREDATRFEDPYEAEDAAAVAVEYYGMTMAVVDIDNDDDVFTIVESYPLSGFGM